MSAIRFLKEQMQRLWQFLGFFQPPFLRVLHGLIVVLVAVQLLSSLGMSSHPQPGSLEAVISGLHVYLGFFLLPFSLFFMLYCWKIRGLKRFYAYLWGETEHLLADIRESLRFHLVSPRPGGLATAVQGLGFCALLLAAATGALWYMGVAGRWPSAHLLKDVHEFSGILVVLYLCGHGSMALLHFIVWQRDVLNKHPHAPHTPPAGHA